MKSKGKGTGRMAMGLYFLGLAILLVCLYVRLAPTQRMERRLTVPYFVQHEGEWYLNDSLYLEKGGYTLEVNAAGGKGGRMVVMSPIEATAENEPGVVYAERVLDGEPFTVHFETEKPTFEVSVRFSGVGESFGLEDIVIKSEGRVYNDAFFWCAVAGLAGVGLYLTLRQAGVWAHGPGALRGKGARPVAIGLYIVLAALLVSVPVMKDFISDAHDLSFQLVRIEGVAAGLRAGQFPVRINPVFTNGVGYAEPAMYPNALLYIPGVLRLCGVSLFAGYQFLILLVNLGTMALGYRCFRELCGSEAAGLCAATLYAFSAYRLANLMVRGALGEYAAMMFLPCVVLGMHQLAYADKGRARWLVIGLTGVFLNHIISTVLCVLYCTVFAVLHLPRLLVKERLLALLRAAGLFAVLNAWAIVPLLYFSTTGLGVYGSMEDPSVTAVWPMQLLGGGYYPMTPGPVLVLGFLVYLAARYAKREYFAARQALAGRGTVLLVSALGALFMASRLCPWEWLGRLPLVRRVFIVVQFAWRYFGLATVFLAALLAIGLGAWRAGRSRVATVAGVLCLSVFLCGGLFTDYVTRESPAVTVLLGDRYTAIEYNVTARFPAEYYREGTAVRTLLAQPPNAVASGGVVVGRFAKNGTAIELDYTAESAGSIDLPLYYYPGYEARLEGARLEVAENGAGMLRVLVPAGSGGVLRVRYGALPVFRVGEAASLAVWFILAGAWAVKRRKKRRL